MAKKHKSMSRDCRFSDKTLHLVFNRPDEILFCFTRVFQTKHLDTIRHDTLSHCCSATIRLMSHSQMSLHDTDFNRVSEKEEKCLRDRQVKAKDCICDARESSDMNRAWSARYGTDSKPSGAFESCRRTFFDYCSILADRCNGLIAQCIGCSASIRVLSFTSG